MLWELNIYIKIPCKFWVTFTKVQKGARQFFSGAGFKYNVVISRCFLFSASKVKNPLENTFVFVDLQLEIID
jgi:hypothetical protein